ncbi:uncharacterized protein LOC111631023 [Centruroides sculpturatus]|uniref:uncharacterized protein LOC111631023 n=1 Tax=Centruroides sculpturatus TaxID=218467 RepID=UPI000C6E5409|nr:uncharacterized protein LOC111631023 [Centruroides sculpturatus]
MDMATYNIDMKECNDIKLAEQDCSSTVDKATKEQLKICQEKLMKRYKNENAYMTSFLWSEHNDLPIKDAFVNVKLQKTDMLGRKTGEIIQIKDIFARESKLHQTILITGDPGYGKSTICKKIAYDWGIDEEYRSYLKEFEILVSIHLGELGEKGVLDAVIECIDNQEDRTFSKKLRKANWNFLIILDGFHEIRDKNCVKQFISNDSIEISKKMTIVVTSRPHVTQEIRKFIDYRFCIEGFSQEQKKKYIDNIVKDEDKKKYVESIIKKNRFCFELAKCPLMLYMLCCLPKSRTDTYIMTNADLFILIFRLIIENYKKTNKETHNLKKGKYFDGEDVIIKLGKLYYEKEFRDITMATSLEPKKVKEADLNKIFTEEECQFLLNLYIFEKRTAENNGEHFVFIHRLFTDFVMAFFIFDSIHTVAFPEMEGILFFILGLFKNEPFAGNFINFLRRIFLHPVTWLNFYNEIKNEKNKELFCTKTTLVFYFDCLDEFFKLSNISKLNKINLNYSRDFQIFVFLDRRFSMDPKRKLSPPHPRSNSLDSYIDLFEPVQSLICLFKSYSWDKFKFYLHGIVCSSNTEFSIICDRNIDIFRKTNEDVKQELNLNYKSPVVLSNESEFGDDRKYLISTNQYYSLLPKTNEDVKQEIIEELELQDKNPVVLSNESESGDNRKYLITKDQCDSLLPYFIKNDFS